MFLFILIYVIAPSFFFPKWGHMFLNYQVFSFYGCFSEGDTNKYRKNRIFWEIAFFCILTSHFVGNYWSKSANFGFGERYWGDLKILRSKSWNFDFLRFYHPSKLSIFVKICQNIAIFEPNFQWKNQSPLTKFSLESWKLACMYLPMCLKNWIKLL